MSCFLAGRLAASEAAFFSHHSKNALLRLKDKVNNSASPPPSSPSSETQADMLPEILRHSLPSQHVLKSIPTPSHPFPPEPSSLAASLTTPIPQRHHGDRALMARYATGGDNPMALFASVPQTTFGPKRWNLQSQEVPVFLSTANEARKEHATFIDNKNLESLLEGYLSVFKAFALATGLVFGGGAIAVGYFTSTLQVHSLEDIPEKGHDYMEPRAEALRRRLEPWKQQAQQWGAKLHMDRSKYETIGAAFKESFGLKQRHLQSNKHNK